MRAVILGFACASLVLAAAASVSADASLELDLATVSTADGVLRRVHASQGLGNVGLPVAGGFDCDGDGLRDYGFSSMKASPGGADGAGIAYLVFGDGTLSGAIDTGIPQASVLEIHGDRRTEATGSEVWMDDVTGDGLGDYLIARQNFRPDQARPGAGALTILVGNPALATHAATLQPLLLANPPQGIVLTTFVGANAVDRLGIWMRTGDITGDGIADIVLGADQEDGGGEEDRGAVYVIRGGPHLAAGGTIDLVDFGATSLAGHLAKIVPPPGSDEYHLGATCQIGDLDGNGRGEVMAAAALNRAGATLRAGGAPIGSAHGNAGSADGTLYIAWDDNFTGNPWPAGFSFDISLAPGFVTIIDGGIPNRDFGEEILAGRDYDADGTADLFVGDIVGDLDGNRPNSGAGHVLYEAATLKGLVFDMDMPPLGLLVTDFLGGASGDIAADTALHGDFDADGIDDLAFSSPHASRLGRGSAGVLHVFFGKVGGWPEQIDLAPGAGPAVSLMRRTNVIGANGTGPGDAGDTLAYSAASADLNGDGLTDVITNEMVGNGPSGVDHGNLILLSGFAVFAPACSDGFDNDGDGLIDFDGGASQNGGAPIADPDPPCAGRPELNRERVNRCGLGFEATLLAALILRRRSRIRAAERLHARPRSGAQPPSSATGCDRLRSR